ncbi:MAG: T9SS type A sorting domain-containing protein [Flavobacterium sp.]|nr:MAG: T9SS type A sorting domain-containing protein [Flavobacterium sp.]
MKNSTLVLLLLAAFQLSAQDVKLVSQSANSIALANIAPAFVSHTKEVNGRKHEDFGKIAKIVMMQAGAPALPVISESVILPDTGKVNLVVEYGAYEEFDNIEVLPSKGSLKRNINPATVAYTFGDAYQQDAFYPGTVADMGIPYIMRDARGITVSFYPYQYNPVSKKLRLYRNISVNVISDTQQSGINEKTSGRKSPNSAYNQMYRNHFINASAFYEPVAEGGEMLIIAPASYMNTMEPLWQWKIKSGMKTTAVSLASTGSTPASIKSYISAFYNANPGLTYVLLVGDHQDLPIYSYGNTGLEELWSDSYYAQLEGSDYYPEVLVGRLSGTVQKVGVMVNRTLEYEKNPMAGSWMKNIAGIASNEGYGYGDDGQADWEHLRAIGNQLLNSGYSYAYEFFEGSQGGNDAEENPNAAMINAAVNSGVGLLNYTGHGAQDEFSTGNYTSANINSLTNSGKYPFVVSVACNNGTFVNGTSLCEAWMEAGTATAPRGAIASCGSSILMAWAEPMQTQDGMADLITGVDNSIDKQTLGGLFYNGQMSMLEAYSQSGTAVEVMQTWVFFGDPSVVYRNRETLAITATHSAEIAPNASQIAIQCSTNGATIAVTQNGVIVGTGVVVNGEAIVTLGEFNPALPLAIIITQQNFSPYQGSVTVNTLSARDFNTNGILVYPNPAKELITVKSHKSSPVTLEIRDITGKIIYQSVKVDLTGGQTINTSQFASGVYLITIVGDGTRETKKFMIR